MGANDAAEALAVCHEVNVANEARITELEERIAGLRLAFDMERQLVAETEHALTQAETALAERMRHDAHGIAATEADLYTARQTIARVYALVDPRRNDPTPLSGVVVRRILDAVTAEPGGVYLDPDEAHLAERACRHSAASIRTVNEIDPDRLHPDVLPYATRLDTLADRLAQ